MEVIDIGGNNRDWHRHLLNQLVVVVVQFLSIGHYLNKKILVAGSVCDSLRRTSSSLCCVFSLHFKQLESHKTDLRWCMYELWCNKREKEPGFSDSDRQKRGLIITPCSACGYLNPKLGHFSTARDEKLIFSAEPALKWILNWVNVSNVGRSKEWANYNCGHAPVWSL